MKELMNVKNLKNSEMIYNYLQRNKMNILKIIFVAIFIFNLFITEKIFAQDELTNDQIQQIIADLDSVKNYSLVETAVELIKR